MLAHAIQIKFRLEESLRHSTVLGPHTLRDGTPGTWDTDQTVLPIVGLSMPLGEAFL